MLTRETVTFRDADGWCWEFDLTFVCRTTGASGGADAPRPGCSTPPGAAAWRA